MKIIVFHSNIIEIPSYGSKWQEAGIGLLIAWHRACDKLLSQPMMTPLKHNMYQTVEIEIFYVLIL